MVDYNYKYHKYKSKYLHLRNKLIMYGGKNIKTEDKGNTDRLIQYLIDTGQISKNNK